MKTGRYDVGVGLLVMAAFMLYMTVRPGDSTPIPYGLGAVRCRA